MPYKNQPAPEFDVFPSYKGGHTTMWGDYIWEFCPGHHLQNRWGWVAQHRMIGEDILGRPLVQSADWGKSEVVHHIDECPTNNSPENLQVMTKRAHQALHAKLEAEKRKARMSEDDVSVALEGRSIKDAAAHLNVHHQTLRNRFPELIAPRKRKSPTDIDDPASLDLIREYALDPKWGMKEAAKEIHVSPRSIRKICEKNNFPWVKKSKVGESHPTYRKKPSLRSLAVNGSAIEPETQPVAQENQTQSIALQDHVAPESIS